MRTARVLGNGESYYHCMSRIIQGQMLINNKEKERFRKIMRLVSEFTGVEVLTYALMDNHLHLLLRVPNADKIPENEVLRRIKVLYGRMHVEEVKKELKELREHKDNAGVELLLNSYTYRMHDLSQYMKMLMQRFTQSYNKRHERRGHLWEGRFKSVLIENKPGALSTMSAYIDLNAVRAGLVEDPKDYRFCGYGEAVAGNKDARKGMLILYDILGYSDTWSKGNKYYRQHVFMQSNVHRKKGASISHEKIEEVLANGGKLSRTELLHCRVRYFSDGVVLGSQAFVEDIFNKYRDEFGLKRKSGARKPRCGDWGELCTMRDLKLSPVTLSSP